MIQLKTDFLPVCMRDVKANGWEELDIILITGDAYIDHPAFGAALLGRYLIKKGFRVGVIAQPQKDEDYRALGRPKLFFGISSGNVDSMVNHYTAQRKIRSEDDFSPNSKAGLRPDRAVQIYTQKVKQFFKDIVVVIGGVEASMRRIPHYDFWSDKVKNSVLIDSKASILVYGNGERQILEIGERLRGSKLLEGIRGTCILSKELPPPAEAVELCDYGTVSDPESFYKMTKLFIDNYQTHTLFYKHTDRYYVHYTPAEPLSTAELDDVYGLPFAREPHPMYKGKIIKAFEQIKHSILSHRGCYGGCSFCMIGFHQGKAIQSRSKESILKEIDKLSKKSYFKKTITDIAGASANMYGTSCKHHNSPTICKRHSCLCPEICKNLVFSEKPYLSVLRAARSSHKVENVFISSGVRFDLALKQSEFMQDLCYFHTSGLLKLAPEHVCENVLKKMYKPSVEKYLKFSETFSEMCKKLEKKQRILPYLIVGFPGSRLEDALELAIFLKKNDLHVEQIQEFTPTPMTIATMMYFTGKDYECGEMIYVPKGREIRLQKALAQWYMKANKKLVAEALQKLNRMDLMGLLAR